MKSNIKSILEKYVNDELTIDETKKFLKKMTSNEDETNSFVICNEKAFEISQAELVEITAKMILEVFSRLYYYSGDEVDIHTPIEQFGLDSLAATELMTKISTALTLRISPTILFETTNILELSDFLVKLHEKNIRKKLVEGVYFDTKPVTEKKVQDPIKPLVTNKSVLDDLWEQTEKKMEQTSSNKGPLLIEGMKSILIQDKDETFECVCIGKNKKGILLMIGGLYSNATLWHHQISSFKNDYKIIIYYPPGHEGSTLNNQIDFSSISTQLETLLEVLNIKKCIAIGWSLGGVILQYSLKKLSNKFDKLILLSTLGKSLKQKITTNNFTADYKKAVQKNKYFTLIDCSMETIMQYSKLLENFDAYPIVQSCNIPTLIISGALDKLSPINEVRNLCKKIKNSKLVEIKDTGHFIPIINQQYISKQFKDFIKI